MSAQCFFDLFDAAEFQGERRRFYGPARLDGHLLGFQQDGHISVRVGDGAALKIEMDAGGDKTLEAGESIESLDAAEILYLEVKPADE